MRFAHLLVDYMMELNLLELLFLEGFFGDLITDVVECVHSAQKRAMLSLVRYEFHFQNRLHYNEN